MFRKPLEDGDVLTSYVVAQLMNAKAGRLDLTLDYVRHASDGRELRRSRERYTRFHAAQ